MQLTQGSKDLNPIQIEENQRFTNKLAEIYDLWGYDEVSPPRIEHIDTLTAGGGINSDEIVQLVADDTIGLRPEMTASIARAACTRLASKERPLRLWASGTVFQSRKTHDGKLVIEENLQSGVELFGIKEISAEMELIGLLLDAMKMVGLDKSVQPYLLIGHTDLTELITKAVPIQNKLQVRKALLNYDRIQLENIGLSSDQLTKLLSIQDYRSNPIETLSHIENLYGATNLTKNIKRLFNYIEPIAKLQKVELRLDPTYIPHYKLYNGIVFQLICHNDSSPKVIAKGGRYDRLVESFGQDKLNSGGVGFSFSVEKLKELDMVRSLKKENTEMTLIAYKDKKDIESAFGRQNELHKIGRRAKVELLPCPNETKAKELVPKRGCNNLIWLGD